MGFFETKFGLASKLMTVGLVLLTITLMPQNIYGSDDMTNDATKCASLITRPNTTYQLFNQDKDFIEDYVDIIHNKLTPGDILRFSDSSEFIFSRTLGEGRTTRILAVYPIQDGIVSTALYALRIPASKKILHPNTLKIPARDFIDKYDAGFEILSTHGVPVPMIDDYLYNEFVLTDIVQTDINGYTFFAHPESIPKNLLIEAEQALYVFAKHLVPFASIGDFKAEQIVYSKKEKRWILIDWADKTELIDPSKPHSTTHPFDKHFKSKLSIESGLLRDYHGRNLSLRELKILNKINTIIMDTRKNKNMSLLERILNKLAN